MSQDTSASTPEFSQGRYLYCVVRTESPEDETEGGVVQSDDESGQPTDVRFEDEGVEDEPVYAIGVDGLAAIVHECDSLYDADDLARVREWLLDHQSVVEAAGEAFGTPLPFRFDTIVQGDDDAVRSWLRDDREEVEHHLSELAGHWEYRVTIERADDPEFDDEELAELEDEAAEASEGRSFLVEKQRDRRESELRRARDEEIATDARRRLEDYAREVESSEESDSVASLSLLVHEDDEDGVGEALDAVAEREGIEVTFTGPWPPYTFAPEL